MQTEEDLDRGAHRRESSSTGTGDRHVARDHMWWPVEAGACARGSVAPLGKRMRRWSTQPRGELRRGIERVARGPPLAAGDWTKRRRLLRMEDHHMVTGVVVHLHRGTVAGGDRGRD